MNQDSDSALFKKYSLRQCYISLTNVLNTPESSIAKEFGCSISKDYPNATGTSTSKKSSRFRSLRSSNITTRRLQCSKNQDPVKNCNTKESKSPGVTSRTSTPKQSRKSKSLGSSDTLAKKRGRPKLKDSVQNTNEKEFGIYKSPGAPVKKRGRPPKLQGSVENINKKEFGLSTSPGKPAKKRGRPSKLQGSVENFNKEEFGLFKSPGTPAKKRGRPSKLQNSAENVNAKDLGRSKSPGAPVSLISKRYAYYSLEERSTKHHTPSESQVSPENLVPKDSKCTKSQDINAARPSKLQNSAENINAKELGLSKSPGTPVSLISKRSEYTLEEWSTTDHTPSESQVSPENLVSKDSKCTKSQDINATSKPGCAYEGQDYSQPSTSKGFRGLDYSQPSTSKGITHTRVPPNKCPLRREHCKCAVLNRTLKTKKIELKNYSELYCPFLMKDSYLNLIPPSAYQLRLQALIDDHYEEIESGRSSKQNISLEEKLERFGFEDEPESDSFEEEPESVSFEEEPKSSWLPYTYMDTIEFLTTPKDLGTELENPPLKKGN